MTIDQLLVFHKIVQCKSFKLASVELNRTQPAISLSIKKLEEELEVDLFDRSHYRPTLTEFGVSFFEKTLKILENFREIEKLKFSFANQEEPELKIAIDGISPLPHFLKLIKTFSERYSFTKLSLDFDILFEVEDKVINEDFTLGITHFISHPQHLEILPFTSVKMIPVINKNLFLEKKIDSIEKLKSFDQIVLGGKTDKKGQSFGLLEDGKKWRVTDYNFKREIILSGLGWGHLPYHVIEREINEGELQVLNLDSVHPKDLDIFLIKSRKFKLGPVGDALWSELTSLHKK